MESRTSSRRTAKATASPCCSPARSSRVRCGRLYKLRPATLSKKESDEDSEGFPPARPAALSPDRFPFCRTDDGTASAGARGAAHSGRTAGAHADPRSDGARDAIGGGREKEARGEEVGRRDRKSTRLNSSHSQIS